MKTKEPMPKKRERSGEEFWKAKCRELEKHIRQLEKQLSYYQRREHILELVDILETQELPDTPETKVHLCPKCSIGELAPKLEFEDKTIYECLSCGSRKSIKK